MADKRAYAKFDIGWLDNPKMLDVLDESHTAALMHAASILYCAQHLTDGVVPVKLMQRKLGGTARESDLLVEFGLWHRPGHDCPECDQPPERSIVVHNYLEHNRSEAEANALAAAGRKGARRRWANRGPESGGHSDSHSHPIGDPNGEAIGHPIAEATGQPIGDPNGQPYGQRERKREPPKGGPGETSQPARRAAKTAIPENWKPTAAHQARATELGLNLDQEAEKFRTHALANDRRQARWGQSFFNWLTNAAEYSAGRPRPPQPSFDPWADDWSEDDIRNRTA